MAENDFDSFPARVYQVIAAIPKGKVATYGQIALLAGAPRYARHVGRVLYNLPRDTKLPWYRVINQQGKISLSGEGYIRQKTRLLKEGIEFSGSDRINLNTYGWVLD